MQDDTRRLWTTHSARLRGFIARRVDNPADVDDLLQEVFLRLHRHQATVRDATGVGAWLFQVARHTIADHYRAAARREVAGPADALLAQRPAEDADPALVVDRGADQARQELATCLTPMIEQLPPVYREAIQLVEIEGLTQPAAAAQTKLSVSGMKSRVQRGRAALRRQLEQCCQIQVDRDGRVVDYETIGASPCAGPKGCGAPPSSPSSNRQPLGARRPCGCQPPHS